MVKQQNYCGCCGNEIPFGDWCLKCTKHILQNRYISIWERTYFAQYNKDCPYQIKLEE